MPKQQKTEGRLPSPTRSLRVFLLGFMGSGKSYTALRLARLLRIPFLDLDEWIVTAEGRSIPVIFRDSGEAHFREQEARQLRKLTQLPRAIVATGGGTPCHHENMDWMNAHGITVFLDVAVPLLVQRLQGTEAERPLLQSIPDLRRFIEDKLAERRPFYEKAQIIVRPESNETDTAQLIFDNLGQLLGH